jgi:hypothetical protein
MARRLELQSVAVHVQRRGAWELGCRQRECGRCPDRAYIGPGGEGERHPGGHGHQ